MRERKNPYANLPALRDLYQQLQASDQEPTRFGIEAFRTRTQSANADSQPKQSHPEDLQPKAGFPDDPSPELPIDSQYVLGPGDQLVLELWGGISQRLSRTVDHEGRIALPEAGTVVLAGKSLTDAQRLVETVLSRQFRNIHAELSLAHVRSVRVYVVGEVERPGAYDLSSVSTALNALFAAGGPTARGSMRRLRHYRGTKLVEEIDLYDFLLLGVRQDTLRFESGDTLQVPLVGPQVTVAGTVKRPAIYELHDEKQLSQVIQLAGGLRNIANLKQISLERIEAHQRHSMLNFGVMPDSNEAALLSSLERLQIADGDRVTVYPIVPYNQAAVYLDGHVFRPGRYAFHDGMKITELLTSREQLLPEPSDHVEVIHLAAPDFRPVAEELSLEQIFSGAKFELHAFDTVRIFGRYETDAPKVAIWGEVLRQGEYPLSAGMTATELVRLAGGFKRGALRSSADLTSYVVEDGKLVTLAPRTLDLAAAMRGDKQADVELKAGDVVTIHQLTGWDDIGASIVLQGEVMHPGTYGIRKGERLSSVIQRAGGFRSMAYPQGAQLERLDVRKQAQQDRDELIRQLETASASVVPDPKTDPQTIQAMRQQQQNLLQALKQQPLSGRMAVQITNDIANWQNTADDLELKNGDVIRIPERPAYVMVSGQVFNPGAVTFIAGKTVDWYLGHSGGFTELSNKKAVFLVRANGSVVGHGGDNGGSVRSMRVHPGDSIVIPAKIVGGNSVWRNVMNSAQVMSSLAIVAAVATNF